MSQPDKNIRLRLIIVMALLLAAAGTTAALYLLLAPSGPTAESTNLPIKNANGAESEPPEPELQLYKPITAAQAEEENDELPFSTMPIERALPLVLPPSQLLPIERRNAIDCLSSAIYYEAGNETSQGKRGVAQVVLNRVRHPAFPNSICGVVYQGSERRTGCQFSFTCDGSLARRPSRKSWEQARLIAIGAISGAVEPTVGMSTHYHANYVMPYWAPSLNKIVKVGSHIFYRWKGSWGRRQAFVQTVQLDDIDLFPMMNDRIVLDPEEDTFEIDLPIEPPSRIVADEAASALTSVQLRPKMTSPIAPEILADQRTSTLTADDQKSTLKTDQ